MAADVNWTCVWLDLCDDSWAKKKEVIFIKYTDIEFLASSNTDYNTWETKDQLGRMNDVFVRSYIIFVYMMVSPFEKKRWTEWYSRSAQEVPQVVKSTGGT